MLSYLQLPKVGIVKTKKQNKAIDKRRLRASEKESEAKHDIMLGRAIRRCYGNGRAKR